MEPRRWSRPAGDDHPFRAETRHGRHGGGFQGIASGGENQNRFRLGYLDQVLQMLDIGVGKRVAAGAVDKQAILRAEGGDIRGQGLGVSGRRSSIFSRVTPPIARPRRLVEVRGDRRGLGAVQDRPGRQFGDRYGLSASGEPISIIGLWNLPAWMGEKENPIKGAGQNLRGSSAATVGADSMIRSISRSESRGNEGFAGARPLDLG